MGKPRSVFSNRDVIDTFRNQQKIAAYERRNNTKVTATPTVTKSRTTKYDNSKGTQIPLGDSIHDIGSLTKRYKSVFSETFSFGDAGSGENKITQAGPNTIFMSAGSEVFRINSGGFTLADQPIKGITTAYFNGDSDDSHSITGTTGGLDYNVENTNETHDFGVSGTAKLTVSNTTVSTPVDLFVTGEITTNSNLIIFGNTTLGNTTSDSISLNGTIATDIDLGTNNTLEISNMIASPSSLSTGSAIAPPSNPTAYFKVKYNGATRYIPYYT